MMKGLVKKVTRPMLLLTAAAGLNTVLWVAFAPIVVSRSPIVALDWSWIVTTLSVLAVVGTLVGAALLAGHWTTRLRWLAFSFFVTPFGPTCFWVWGAGNEPSGSWMVRGHLYLTAASCSLLVVLAALAHVNPANPEAWLRAGAGLACVLGLWHATLVTRGKSYLWPLVAIAVAVGLLMAVNSYQGLK